MKFGIHLANGANNVDRLLATGASSFVGLHHQLWELLYLKSLGYPVYIRHFGRDILSQSRDDFAGAISWIGLNPRIDVTLGNEFNMAVEGTVYSPQETAQRLGDKLDTARKLHPEAIYHLPAFSPSYNSIATYTEYYAVCKDLPFDKVDVHAYGSVEEVLKVLNDVGYIFPNKKLVITEWNFGAGRTVDLASYSREAGYTLARIPDNVENGPHWFIWRWFNPDVTLPTPVDLEGSALLPYLNNYSRKESTDVMADITLPAEFPTVVKLTPNFGSGRPKTIGIFIHATRGGASTIQQEYDGTVNYLKTPGVLASAHFVVGPKQVTRMVHDVDVAWHAIENNQTHLGIEIAQPASLPPFTDFQYRATAAIVRAWCDKYNILKRRVYSQTHNGIIGHEDSEQGKREGKSDPGFKFDWTYFLKLVIGASSPPVDPHPEIYGGKKLTVELADYLRAHPDIGQPRHDADFDIFGNPYVWLSSSTKYRSGSLLYHRKWMNKIREFSWD